MSAFSVGRYKLTAEMAARSLRCCPELGYLYLNNQKAACSTIKYSLLVHARKVGLIASLPANRGVHSKAYWRMDMAALDGRQGGFFTFSFVRNPYTRLLSCYRDKIARDHKIRARLCEKHGIARSTPISFAEFVQLIIGTDHHDCDPHWRPQYLNLLVDYLPGDAMIGHLETFEEDFELITDRTGVLLQPARLGHATNANEHLAQYNEQTRDAVYRYYERDFVLFGYDPDLAIVEPQRREVRLPARSLEAGSMLRSLFEPVQSSCLSPARVSAPIPLRQLSLLQLRCQAGEDVVNDLERLRRAYPEDEDFIAIEDKKSALDAAGGRAQVAALEQLRTSFPFSLRYRLRLARLYLRSRKVESAKAELTAALSIKPDAVAVKQLAAELQART